jgi:hypothetical protein
MAYVSPEYTLLEKKKGIQGGGKRHAQYFICLDTL